MTALVVCETLLLVVLTFLVAGLLRSHAEILRRIGPPDDEDGDEDALRLRRHAPARREHELAAADVAGATLGGDSVAIGFRDPGFASLDDPPMAAVERIRDLDAAHIRARPALRRRLGIRGASRRRIAVSPRRMEATMAEPNTSRAAYSR